MDERPLVPARPAVAWEAPAEPVGPAPGIEFAPHGPRLAAYLIDSLVLSIAAVTMLVPILWAKGRIDAARVATESTSGDPLVGITIINIGASALMEHVMHRLGKEGYAFANVNAAPDSSRTLHTPILFAGAVPGEGPTRAVCAGAPRCQSGHQEAGVGSTEGGRRAIPPVRVLCLIGRAIGHQART